MTKKMLSDEELEILKCQKGISSCVIETGM